MRVAHVAPRNSAFVEAAFQAVPDSLVAEILDGELFTTPRPGTSHARIALRLESRLAAVTSDESDAGWLIMVEPELHLGARPDKVVPDLAGWRRPRLAEDPFDDLPVTATPDWVCEVLHPDTERLDRGRKRRNYAAEGVGYLWLLDPRIQTLEVYRAHHGRWLEVETFEGAETVRAEPFESVVLKLPYLWLR